MSSRSIRSVNLRLYQKGRKGIESSSSFSGSIVPCEASPDQTLHCPDCNEAFILGDLQKVTFSYPKQICHFRKRKAHFENIQEYAPLRTHRWSASQQFLVLLPESSHLAFRLGRRLSKEKLTELFTSFGLRDVSGIIHLMNLEEIASVLLNFVDFCLCQQEHSIYVDVNLVQQLSLGSCILSQGFIFEGDAPLGREWLNLSSKLLESLETPTKIADIVYFGIWVLAFKTPNMMLNEIQRIVTSFHALYDLVCQSPQILLYFEPNMSWNNLLSEAAARTWIETKMSETEINVLGIEAPFHPKADLLRRTIQPEEFVLQNLFKTDNFDDGRYCSRTHLVLFVCSRYFGRFKDGATPRELIFSYLLLHQEVNDIDSKVSASLRRFSNLELLNLTTEFSDLMTNLIMLKYFAIRLLLFVKLERPYFPSLRFAHYVTNLMCIFNWSFQIAQDKALPLSKVFERILKSAYFADIMLFYFCCCFQSIFLCVFTHFKGNAQETTIDINYLVEAVSKSNSQVLQAVRALEYSKIEIIARLLEVIDSLCAYRTGCTTVFTFHEFYNNLQLSMDPESWNNLVLLCFGCQQVCKTHMNLLWCLASHVQRLGTKDIYITKSMQLNTSFFQTFEDLVEPFRFSKGVVDAYMDDVVNIAI